MMEIKEAIARIKEFKRKRARPKNLPANDNRPKTVIEL
jgi:hypothetical protein